MFVLLCLSVSVVHECSDVEIENGGGGWQEVSKVKRIKADNERIL